MTNTITPAARANPDLELEKAHLDWRSTRTQLFFGALAIVLLCVCQYVPSLSIGLLLDDFNHVECVHRAVHGDWHDFLLNFYSAWGKLDALKAYRPVISVSFLIDHLLYRLHYYGYHLTNILTFAASAVLVSLITLELCGSTGNRLKAAAAVWAGLLFAAYPGHVESVAWIIGRVDVICGLFYYAAIFCFLRYRLVQTKALACCTVLFFILGMGSKEPAVTLPLVLTLAASLLPLPKYAQTGSKRRQLTICGILWALLFVFACLRQVILGAFIGGYGPSSIDTVLNSIRVFSDPGSLKQILIPLNKALHISYSATWLVLAAAVLAMLGGYQAFREKRAFLFLFGWMILAVVPTYQIWKISPNLVGSRLFYISSAPLCIAFALAGTAALTRLTKNASKAWTTAGVIALLVLFGNWVNLTKIDLIAWTGAGTQLQQAEQQLRELTENMPPDRKILLLDLPEDFAGAGLIARPQVLAKMAGPPFLPAAVVDRFQTDEPLIFGSHDYLWPSEFHLLIEPPATPPFVFVWNNARGLFTPWRHPKGVDRADVVASKSNISVLPVNTEIVDDLTKWRQGSKDVAVIEKHDHFLRIFAANPIKRDPGVNRDLRVVFPIPIVDPTRADLVLLEMKVGGEQLELARNRCRFIWSREGQWNSAGITYGGMTKPYSWLGRYRSWSYGKGPELIGLTVPPGNYYIDLKSLTVQSSRDYRISTKFDGHDTLAGLPEILNDRNHKLSYDATNVPEAKRVRLKLSGSYCTFDPNSEADFIEGPQSTPVSTIAGEPLKGTIMLSELGLNHGIHQILLQAEDEHGKVTGLGAEPVSVDVRYH